MFNKYKKDTNDYKVMLLYLLLNEYSLQNVKYIEEYQDVKKEGLSINKLYAVTKDFVNVQEIEKEVSETFIPHICSRTMIEHYINEPYIHIYTPNYNNSSLYINDMSVISKFMVIEEDYIISSSVAKDMQSARKTGFMFFYNYVLNNSFKLEQWYVEYNNNDFNVYYYTTKEQKEKLLLFSATNIDKANTYQIVLYIISKISCQEKEYKSDNFNIETYVKKDYIPKERR